MDFLEIVLPIQEQCNHYDSKNKECDDIWNADKTREHFEVASRVKFKMTYRV